VEAEERISSVCFPHALSLDDARRTLPYVCSFISGGVDGAVRLWQVNKTEYGGLQIDQLSNFVSSAL